MSKLERAFITTADKTWKKVIDKNGDTMHFADGTPKTEEAFNAATQHKKYEGEPVKVAVPSKKGPGYERKEVNPLEASALGQELNLFREDIPGEPRKNVLIDGKEYDTDTIADLNDRIADRHGSDALFRYT